LLNTNNYLRETTFPAFSHNTFPQYIGLRAIYTGLSPHSGERLFFAFNANSDLGFSPATGYRIYLDKFNAYKIPGGFVG
jgi:hypothetical protein